jgi:branched-chain amino acid transport system substrate-binding protein
MKTKKGLLVLVSVVCIAIVLLLAACPAAPTTTTPPPATTTPPPTTTAPPLEPVKIGFLACLTGFLAEKGYPEAIQVFPEYYGTTVNGQQYQIIVEDTASDPATALDKAKKLVETDHVQFLVGPLNGAGVLTVGDYATKMNIPNFVVAPGILWDNKANPANNLGMVFCASGTINGEDYILGQYMYQQGIRTIDTIGSDFVAGYDFIGAAVKGFVEAGGTVVQAQWIPPGDTDVAPYITNLQEADALLWWIASDAGPVFQQQYKEYGGTMPFYRPDGAEYVTDTDLDLLGETAVGMRGTTFSMYTLDYPLTKQLDDAWVNVTGHHAGQHGAQIVNIFQIILDTVKAIGGNTDADAFIQQLTSAPIDTWKGPVQFTSDGGIIENVYIYEDQMVNGEVIPVLIETFPDVDCRLHSPPGDIGKDYTGVD